MKRKWQRVAEPQPLSFQFHYNMKRKLVCGIYDIHFRLQMIGGKYKGKDGYVPKTWSLKYLRGWEGCELSGWSSTTLKTTYIGQLQFRGLLALLRGSPRVAVMFPGARPFCRLTMWPYVKLEHLLQFLSVNAWLHFNSWSYTLSMIAMMQFTKSMARKKIMITENMKNSRIWNY